MTYSLPRLIHTFFRYLVGIVTRKLSNVDVCTSCRLLPRLAKTYKVQTQLIVVQHTSYASLKAATFYYNDKGRQISMFPAKSYKKKNNRINLQIQYFSGRTVCLHIIIFVVLPIGILSEASYV